MNITFITRLTLICGLLTGSCCAMENNVITDIVTFTQKVLKDRSLATINGNIIEVALDQSAKLASATSDAISWGPAWKTFANKPDIIKAVISHEVMHILHGDCNNSIIGFFEVISELCSYAETFVYTKSLQTIADYNWGEDTARNNLISIIVPFILAQAAHFSSNSLFHATKAEQTIRNPTSIGKFFGNPLIIACINFLVTNITIPTINLPSFYQNFIGTISYYLEGALSYISTSMQSLIKTSMPILLTWLFISVMKKLILYPTFARMRTQEFAADFDGAQRFDAVQGAIALLNQLKELHPEKNIASPINDHPTFDERIAALQPLVPH